MPVLFSTIKYPYWIWTQRIRGETLLWSEIYETALARALLSRDFMQRAEAAREAGGRGEEGRNQYFRLPIFSWVWGNYAIWRNSFEYIMYHEKIPF